MFRFTIRDLLWLMMVVGLLVCLILEFIAARSNATLAARRQAELAAENEKLRSKWIVHEESLTRIQP